MLYLRSGTSDIRSYPKKHLNLLSWSKVRDGTGLSTGSARLEMHFSFHVKGRNSGAHPHSRLYHTPPTAAFSVNPAPLPDYIRFPGVSGFSWGF